MTDAEKPSPGADRQPPRTRAPGHLPSPEAAIRASTAPAAQRRLHRLFEIAILVKGIDGLLETAVGLVLVFVQLHSLNDIVAFVIDKELSTDPADWIVDLLSHASVAISTDAKRLASLYLISHGLVKLFLVFALWREWRAAFPVALGFMALFVVFQLHRYIHTHSVWLLVFASIDMIVGWLIWREYRTVRVQGVIHRGAFQ
jgi:uncharacterized membrane protein